MNVDSKIVVDSDVVKHFNFGRGFAFWQLQWKLHNKIGSEDGRSEDAELSFWLSDDSRSIEVKLIGRLEILHLSSTCICVTLCSFRMPLPTLFRLALYAEGRGVIYSWTGKNVFDWPSDTASIQLSPEESRLLNDADNLSLHAFVAVPQGVSNVREIDQTPFFQLESPSQKCVPYTAGASELIDGFAKLLPFVLDDEDEQADGDYECTIPPSDITLVIDKEDETERNFHCHSTILITRSPYFGRLLRRRRASSRSISVEKVDEGNAIDRVKLDDIDEATMEIVLGYIYAGQLPTMINSENGDQKFALKIAAAATKFQLKKLKEYCVAVLIFRYSRDEMRFEQLAVARRAKIRDLESVCLQQVATWWICNQTKSMGKMDDIPWDHVKDDIHEIANGYVFGSIDVKETCKKVDW